MDTVPSAMDSIGIADLVGPVAKMAPRPGSHQPAKKTPVSLLSMMDSSGIKSAANKLHGGRNRTSAGEIDSLLEASHQSRPGMQPPVTTEGSTKPWNRLGPAPSHEPKRAHLGSLIQPSKQQPRRMREPVEVAPQGIGKAEVVGPTHVINQHQSMTTAPQDRVNKPTIHEQKASVNTNITKDPSSKASSFVASLKKHLPKGSFLQISQALRQYASTKDIEPLLETTSRELCAPSYASLSNQFRERIPEEYRERYDAAITNMRLRAQSTAPAPLAQRPHCPKCKKQISKDPFKSSCCDKVACYSCWLGAVAMKTCFACQRPMKKSMLSRVSNSL